MKNIPAKIVRIGHQYIIVFINPRSGVLAYDACLENREKLVARAKERGFILEGEDA